jgi:3-methylcrotonyl-CoA carboxylase beta subunit
MATLQSKVNIRSEDYAANKTHMEEQIDDLHRVLAEIRLGGGEKYRERHFWIQARPF